MKHTRLVLSLSLVACLATFSIARADSFDSDDATIQKKSDSSVKVLIDKKTYVVPIKFGDGADWDSVKDHYELWMPARPSSPRVTPSSPSVPTAALPGRNNLSPLI